MMKVEECQDERFAAVKSFIEDFVSLRSPKSREKLAEADPSLVTSGSLDSIGILELVLSLGERFNLEVDEDVFNSENFASVSHLAQFVVSRSA